MNNFIFKKYVQLIERNGYFPMMFQPYNCSEIFDVSSTLTANCGSKGSSATVLITNLGDEEMNKSGIIVLGNYSLSGHDASRIVDGNGVAPTVKENHGTVTAVVMEESNKIMIDEAPKKLFNIYPKGGQAGNVYDANCCAPCLPGFGAGGGGKEMKVLEGLRIRKLTPKECWRLMGFDDEDFYKAEAVNSNAQLYKQAGNSIVVDVIEKIYEKLFERYGGGCR